MDKGNEVFVELYTDSLKPLVFHAAKTNTIGSLLSALLATSAEIIGSLEEKSERDNLMQLFATYVDAKAEDCAAVRKHFSSEQLREMYRDKIGGIKL